MQVFLCIKGYVVSFYHNICIVAAQCFIWLYKMDKMKKNQKEKAEKEKKNKHDKENQTNRTDKNENKQKIIVLHTSYI